MEPTQVTEIPTPKIYTENAILGGTFLGGPLAAAYFMASNFKALGQADKVKMTWLVGIIVTVIITGVALLIPDNIRFPNQLIPITYTVIIYYLAKHIQGQAIKAHLHAGGLSFSGWRVVAVGFIGLAVTLIAIILYVYVSDTTAIASTSAKSYGAMQNTIDYDSSTITETETDKLADALIKTMFFDNEVQKYVYAKKVNNTYELSISVVDGTANDKEALQVFTDLRNNLQSYFPNHKIVLILVADNLDNVVKRIE